MSCKIIHIAIIVKCIMVIMEIILGLQFWYFLIKRYFCFNSFKTWDFCHNQMLQSWQTRNMATFVNYIGPKSLFVSCLTPIEIFIWLQQAITTQLLKVIKTKKLVFDTSCSLLAWYIARYCNKKVLTIHFFLKTLNLWGNCLH